MKYIIFLGILLSTFILGCDSCKEELIPTLSSCGNGFVLNEDQTKCICPPETHYLLTPVGVEQDPLSGDYAGKSCLPKGAFTYYVQFDANNCIGGGIEGLSNDFLDLNPIGSWIFSKTSENNNEFLVAIYFVEGNQSARLGGSVFPVTIDELENGKVEVNFTMQHMYVSECLDWKDKTDRLFVQGYGHGISNEGNTKIDIEVIYKDTDGLVLDTSYIHLWKE